MEFKTYEELVDYCYPYSKNLATKGIDYDRFSFLLDIERIYQQQVDKYATMLDIRRMTKVIISRNSRYWRRCFCSFNVIELDVSLICYHPLVLTEVVIHELTHYKYHNHKPEFYLGMEKYVQILGLQDKLYAFTNRGKFPTSIDAYCNDYLSPTPSLFLFKRIPSLEMIRSFVLKNKIKIKKDDIWNILDCSHLYDSRQRVRNPDDAWFEKIIGKEIKSNYKQLLLFE